LFGRPSAPLVQWLDEFLEVVFDMLLRTFGFFLLATAESSAHGFAIVVLIPSQRDRHGASAELVVVKFLLLLIGCGIWLLDSI
jgi:hypothetical protein